MYQRSQGPECCLRYSIAPEPVLSEPEHIAVGRANPLLLFRDAFWHLGMNLECDGDVSSPKARQETEDLVCAAYTRGNSMQVKRYRAVEPLRESMPSIYLLKKP